GRLLAPMCARRSRRRATCPPDRWYWALLPGSRASPAVRVHRRFPGRSGRGARGGGEDRCVSVTAVAVSAGTARGEPSPPRAVDASGPAIPNRRWTKWAVGAAIGGAIGYTGLFFAGAPPGAPGAPGAARPRPG